VSRGRDGQELSESLDDPQYYCERWAPFIHAYTMLGFRNSEREVSTFTAISGRM
jgi:hypothetical protein